jgi:hypothetical protein
MATPRTFDKQLTPTQAARVIFRSRAPTANQVKQVCRLMEAGMIAARRSGVAPSKWTTTESAIADFLAERQLHRESGGENPTADTQQHDAPDKKTRGEVSRELKRVYRGVWRDYFLAVMLRRRMCHRSATFQHIVTYSQVTLLTLLVALAVSSAFRISSAVTVPPEQLAVERWIESQTDAFAIERWLATRESPQTEGRIVGVEYRYRLGSPRWVHTKRTFHVSGGQVTEMIAPD